MQILSVALQNFKTHRDRYFEFQPGTNAICGENGAGKTSILEAIAWVLFNYQGDYAKEDLIRNGSGSAQVTVVFTSNYDQRTYQVQRCTQRGYALFDPQLNERLPYTRIKDEVLPWLRQHLGVGATTNLPQLFSRTVGVPQGTFTADFLQPAEHRKAVFDAILKVDDYKLAFKQMNALRRYADDQVLATKGQIAQYDESLAGWDDLQQRLQAVNQALAVDDQRLQVLTVTLTDLQSQRERAAAQVQQVQALTQQRQERLHRQVGLAGGLDRLRQAVQQADQAIALCETHRSAYEGYCAADQALQALAKDQQERQRLDRDLQALRQRQGQIQVELARWQTQREACAATEQDLAQLQPQIAIQMQLESDRQTVQRQIDQCRQWQLQQQQGQTQLAALGQQVDQLRQSRDRLVDLQPAIAEIPTLEAQRDRLQQQRSRLAAARQFEAEIRALVSASTAKGDTQRVEIQALLQELTTLATSVPLLSGPTLDRLRHALDDTAALHSGLIAALEAILQDLVDQTDADALQTSLQAVDTDLKQRYGWQADWARLDDVTAQIDQALATQQDLRSQVEAATQQLAQLPTLQASLAAIDLDLQALGRPREKSQILERTLQDRPRIDAAWTAQTAALATVDSQSQALVEQLARFGDLDGRLAQAQGDRARHQAGHSLYLQHQQLAQQHGQLQADLTRAEAEAAQIAAQLEVIEEQYREAVAAFDPAAAAQLETTYNQAKSEADRLSGSLPQQRQRLADLQQQLAGLAALRDQRQTAQDRLRSQEKAKRFITFARKAYNEAGPRITEQYVRSISQQADRLFRDLLDRPNVALQWSKDYEILVQDGPNQRRFVNLSGGEQMCAALAVRLALLKVLADVDIAFFDEPTTNMDRTRRQGLAEAIGRIKTFQQLFVISHDDTFEQLTENVIVVERDGG